MAEFSSEKLSSVEDMEVAFADCESGIVEDSMMRFFEDEDKKPQLLIGEENYWSNKNPLQETNSSTSGVCSEKSDEYVFKETELFHFLNATLQGKIILGKYKKTRILDYTKLKELLIFGKIIEDPISYKIKTEQFNKWRFQIKELFETENPDCFFVSSFDNKDKEVIGARGCLYNYYKIVRKELRSAGILTTIARNLESPHLDENIDDHPKLDCLTDENRKPYTLHEITKAWDETYEKRKQLLRQEEKKKKNISLELYFRTYTCLGHPLGSILLEQDFNRLSTDFVNRGSQLIDETIDYSSLFCSKWPIWASKIVSFCKKKRRTVEIKEFFEKHKTLIDAGTHNSVLALFLLPFCLKAIKKIKIDKNTSVSLTKRDVAESFIVYVENYENLYIQQKEFEERLAALKQQILPYLLFCGKLENLQVNVILNGEKYVYEDALIAVESCYKCLMALHVFPSISESVWLFIHKAIFNFPTKKISVDVDKLITDLNKE